MGVRGNVWLKGPKGKLLAPLLYGEEWFPFLC